jgi:Tfp pilus assembly protein PilF
MIKTCPRCGHAIEPGDFYCGMCGFNIFEKESQISFTQVELGLDDIRIKLGNVYIKKGEYSKAIETLEKVLEENPKNIEAQHLLDDAREALKSITTTE